MSIAVKKLEAPKRRTAINPILLVNEIEMQTPKKKSWFWSLLTELFKSHDLDYAQFKRLESKRTRHQIERARFY